MPETTILQRLAASFQSAVQQGSQTISAADDARSCGIEIEGSRLHRARKQICRSEIKCRCGCSWSLMHISRFSLTEQLKSQGAKSIPLRTWCRCRIPVGGWSRSPLGIVPYTQPHVVPRTYLLAQKSCKQPSSAEPQSRGSIVLVKCKGAILYVPHPSTASALPS